MTKSKAVAAGFLLLLLNTGWVWAFPEASVFYIANVLLHIVLGLGLLLALWVWRAEAVRSFRQHARAATAVLSLAGALGVLLCFIGATRPNLWVVAVHGSFGFVGGVLAWIYARKLWPGFAKALAVALLVALAMPAGSRLRLRWFPRTGDRIVNPTTAPVSMEYEGAGSESPFFPSSARSNTGDLIPSDFFLDSKVCGECHEDIYEQWNSSMHHFSSFNNQFYRKSIEYMQEVTGGVEASKWCAGCHDHAMFFNGQFERPVKEQIDTTEALAGLGCMSCHSITRVSDTMGNGGFTITYPPLHEMSKSDNPVIKTIHDYFVNTAPAAHRQAFMKPFMRLDKAEFCATCHKVHLDVPVNDYRWFRGFNEYDNWQASGVSGYGARSFYYPEQPADCTDCHMPLVKSDDPGNVDGYVHSHRFPAANTAVPYVNQDEEQLRVTKEFLEDGIVSVDIFAASPAEEETRAPAMRRRVADAQVLSTGFAVGEEAEAGSGTVLIREVGKIAAPIDRASAKVEAGHTIKVDVVVRTRKVGHFFPGGTVDAFDVWLELQAVDADGRIIFWSGAVENEGEGAVEKGAHFYRAFLLDGHGNPINKRNAFQARSALYVRLIPPGAADVAHFRMKIPENSRGPIRLLAKLNYRKFSHYYTQFAYAGQPDPTDTAGFSKGHDDRRFTFSPADIPENVAGQIKDRIPNLPIVVLARAEAKLEISPGKTNWGPAVQPEDAQRWNDYGIGLLLQGDLRGAEYAFQRVTEADPEFADGWLNVARALVQEGQTDAAKPFVERALAIDDSLARVHFFHAKILRAEGDYDGALAALRRAESQYPRDRVVLNEIANILFLKRQYEEAIAVLDRVARIDPEDLQMHYRRMLCYRGLGDTEGAAREEKLFRRFKADESAQTVTARIRRLSPEDNNERQSIHEHVSVELPVEVAAGAAGATGGAGGRP